MSETSESVQLFGASGQDVFEAARREKLSGLVIETEGRWLCFVPFDAEEIERATTLSLGLSIIWRYAADFGLWLIFFEDGRRVGALHFDRNADSTVDFDLRACLARHKANPVLADQLGDLKTELAHTSLHDAVASRLGLTAYAWLSPQYAGDSMEELVNQFPGLRIVSE
jgi:hypothetical protein